MDLEIQIVLWGTGISFFIIVPLLVYFGKNEGVSFWSALAAINLTKDLKKRIKSKFRLPIWVFMLLGTACYVLLLYAKYNQP